jgi:serine/threonine protein kinase/Tol biopolymer transport system component
MPLNPGVRLGPYEIVSAIGAGGMGEVYKARDTRLDRTVAIKVLPSSVGDDPARRQRLEREARAVSSLDHPHICALYDVGRERIADPGTPGPARDIDYLVMQYLEGETLATRLERGALPVDEALRTGAQIADALAAAHRRGIVHRDLKPGNVMLTRAGARLLDFGLAKSATSVAGLPTASAANDMTRAAPLTSERTIVGTLQYMAPEQLEGKEVDARTDIFALGAVLYEMVAGQRAFAGDSSATLIAAILTAQPRPLTGIAPLAPAALSRVTERCMAKDPEDRWQSSGDLAFELRSLQAPSVESVAAPVPAHARRRYAALIPWGIAALAVVLAFAVPRLTSTRTSSGAPDIRLSVLPPVGHEFSTDVADYDPDFAMSPDGTQIAFVTIDAAGARHLWVRNLSAIEARQLPGTEGARQPFWSPDGRSVGYVGSTGLTRVPAAGGPPQVFTSDRTVRLDSNVSWGSAGQILFDRVSIVEGAPTTGLSVVDETGGEARPVPRGDHAVSELAQRYPVFLPDGRHFIYLGWSAEPSERGIFLGSLDSDQRTLLVKTGFRAAFVKPDLLVYVRERALVAQRLVLDPPGLVGGPRVVVEGLALEAIPGQATYAVSESGTILYRTRTRAIVSELQWVDRTGRMIQTAAERASDITAALSPDNRTAATTRIQTSAATEERPPGNIWLVDLQRGIPTRLTLDSSTVDENPVWSPDGKRIAYASHRGSGLAEVLVQPVGEGGRGKVLATGGRNLHPIDWSRDGDRLLLHAYATGSGADDMDLWVLPVRDNATPVPFIQGPFAQAQGQFSPDGRFVAYSSDESGRTEVYVRAFPTGEGRRQISAQGGAQPRWRSDGREIFYVSPSGTVMAVALSVSSSELTAGSPVPLFTEPSLRVNNSMFFYGGAAGYDVSRDGKRFLVNRLIREPTAGPLHVVLNAVR